MALSQILDDSPLRFAPKQPGADALLLQELYNERHRLALEELLSGGVGDFLEFLGRERIPNFLSDEEIQRIRAAVVPPPGASIPGEEQGAEQSLAGSLDCSSVTYFPEVSDVEPPLLEIGWPAFTAGSYRGVTRAVAHFQPSYGESIYSCKEAARRMVKSAREVIAIVTDSLTDLDIFKDLQEACSHRQVPVYILLDQSSAPAFLKMCRSVGVRLDDLQQMRVRTITGTSYYMRSGARITGKVHERFMLIDGNRVATGSYRFNWTDGKLNSSNLIELSGQITEKFDEEFRVLYAQSLPISTRGPPSVRGSGVFEHLVIKHPAASSPLPVRDGQARPACLTSTPSRKPQTPAREASCQGQRKAGPASDDSPAVDGDWAEQPEEILAGCSPLRFPLEQQAEKEPVTTAADVRHVSTQTGPPVTDLQPAPDASPSAASPEPAPPTHRAPDGTLKDSFHKLTKERLHRYSAIRSKLEHMVTALTERRELADISNVTQGLGVGSRQRIHKDRVREPNPRLPVESVGTGTWPRARCAN